jgi:hypothetical protein
MVLGDRAGPTGKLTLFQIEFRPLLPQREASLLQQVLDIFSPRYEGEQKAINPALVGKQVWLASRRAMKSLSESSLVIL